MFLVLLVLFFWLIYQCNELYGKNNNETYESNVDDDPDDLQKYYTGLPRNSLPENRSFQPILDDRSYLQEPSESDQYYYSGLTPYNPNSN